jgi:transcriptional regulator with XRE-family HTH domain
MNIGNAIRKVRKEKGLSQCDVALACNFTQNALSQIEKGHTKPHPSTIKRMANVFGISEPLLYILAIEKEDVPKEREQIYEMLYPSIEALIYKLL